MRTRRLHITMCAIALTFPFLQALCQETATKKESKDLKVEVYGRPTSLSNYVNMLQRGTDLSFNPTHWGDQGNGTYINPVLNADFSDPDVIRVGDTYYMVASDFHYMGMQVLSSQDLVNWQWVSQIYSRFETPGWETMENYAKGSWAPAIRYHDGKFFVYFCSPDDGLYMTTATDVKGPWSPLLLMHEGAGWEDPCPFWDEDGNAYLGHSVVGAGPIIIHRMSPDGRALLDEGVEVYRGTVAEGTKFHKKDGYYYLSIPEGGVARGNQVVLRATSIYGPYEKKLVLERGSTPINGPHQGAIVDTPAGEWYFIHFQQTNVLGRVVHLQPMFWQDGWPVIGVDIDRNGVGEPVFSWSKPKGVDSAPSKPVVDDDFSSSTLSLAWQFNHNAVPGKWSLEENKGKLTIHAMSADNLKHARNTLTQKLFGYRGTITVELDVTRLKDGDKAGLGVMGTLLSSLGVKQADGKKQLYTEDLLGGESLTEPLDGKANKVYLRFTYDAQQIKFQYYYSTNGIDFKLFGDAFQNVYADWKGVRPALFCYNTTGKEGGMAQFDNFQYDFDEKLAN